MIKLFDKPIKVNKSATDRQTLDVGANLFVGNLDPDVDEKVLYDTFSAFGGIVGQPKIMRDPETGNSKGFGFVSFDTFEASDAAIEAMSGQHLMNRPLVVQYAYKKDTKGERHGTPAERLLAAQRRALMETEAATARPHTLFSTGPQPLGPAAPPPGSGPGMPLPPIPPMMGFPPPGMGEGGRGAAGGLHERRGRYGMADIALVLLPLQVASPCPPRPSPHLWLGPRRAPGTAPPACRPRPSPGRTSRLRPPATPDRAWRRQREILAESWGRAAR